MNTFPLGQIFLWCLIATAFVLIDSKTLLKPSSCSVSMEDTVSCPPDTGDPNENATLLPNPYNCSTYFECVHGRPIELLCPGNLYFDPVLRVCNYQDQVNCQISGLMPNLIPCKNENGTVQYFPNPQDCCSYLVCDPSVNGFAVLQHCADGLMFNPDLNVCDYPYNVKCP